MKGLQELVFEIRKRDSLTVEFSLSLSNSHLHVAWEMDSSRHKVLSCQLKIHNRKMAVSWHPWFGLHCLEERVLFMGSARELHIGKWFLEEGMQVDKNNCSLPHLERKLIALLSAFKKNIFMEFECYQNQGKSLLWKCKGKMKCQQKAILNIKSENQMVLGLTVSLF